MVYGVHLSKADCPTPDKADAALKHRYQSTVGAMIYAMNGTRPDIAYAVTKLSQFSSNPGVIHWQALKHLGRYLKGTQDYCITYRAVAQSSMPPLLGYCDSDWAENVDHRRSVTGYAFLLCHGAVSWQSRTQQTVATSSTQAEYMAATEATKEAMWWRMFFKAINKHNEGPTVICSDNQGSIALAKNPEHHRRTKHIDVQYHFVREQVAGKTVVFKFVPSIEMAADVLTKALPNPRHRLVVRMLGVDTLQSSLSGSVGVDRQPRLQSTNEVQR